MPKTPLSQRAPVTYAYRAGEAMGVVTAATVGIALHSLSSGVTLAGIFGLGQIGGLVVVSAVRARRFRLRRPHYAILAATCALYGAMLALASGTFTEQTTNAELLAISFGFMAAGATLAVVIWAEHEATSGKDEEELSDGVDDGH